MNPQYDDDDDDEVEFPQPPKVILSLRQKRIAKVLRKLVKTDNFSDQPAIHGCLDGFSVVLDMMRSMSPVRNMASTLNLAMGAYVNALGQELNDALEVLTGSEELAACIMRHPSSPQIIRDIFHRVGPIQEFNATKVADISDILKNWEIVST